jgi:integrase
VGLPRMWVLDLRPAEGWHGPRAGGHARRYVMAAADPAYLDPKQAALGRALIATLTYSFARIGAALKMKVEDLRPRGAGWTVHLHEKGGKEHAMPCHHALAEALRAFIDAAGIAEDREGWLFRTARGHKADTLSDRAMNQSDAWCMIRRRAKADPSAGRKSKTHIRGKPTAC